MIQGELILHSQNVSCRFYQLVKKLQQTSQSDQVATSLLKSGLLQLVTTC